MPPGYKLDAGEQVVRRIYRSPLYLLPVFVSAALIVVAAIFGLASYARFRDQLDFLPPGFVMAIAGTLVAIAALMLLSAWYVFRRNYLVITNMHVIKSEQIGLFNEQTAQLDLSRVQDVSGARKGVMGTIFNYGDIEIETAGAQENFIFRATTGPQALADQLLQYHEDYLKANPGRELP